MNTLRIAQIVVAFHNNVMTVAKRLQVPGGKIGIPYQMNQDDLINDGIILPTEELKAVQTEFAKKIESIRSDMMFAGFDPDRALTQEEQDALPKHELYKYRGFWIETKKAETNKDNAEIRVLQAWGKRTSQDLEGAEVKWGARPLHL
jgi:hypothetical protein